MQECLQVEDKEILKRIEELATTDRIKDCLDFILKLEAQGQSSTVRAFRLRLWVRFLFSCLIDADRIDSADFELPSKKAARNMLGVDWMPAITRLEHHLGNMAIRNDIDTIRNQISQECLWRANDHQGLCKLTVPTGGGITYASIRFALHHAHKHKLKHIIYIVPFTSIIDRNAADIRKILEKKGDAFRWVLEQHSNLEPEKQTWQSKLVAENWDAPIIFTTVVQFLETLFGGWTRGARRFHQLAKSVLIFDEIQMLPIKCFHLFCNALDFLVEHTQTTAILCTATQPALDRLRDPEKGQLKMSFNSELISNVAERFEQLKRVNIINRYRPQGWTEKELTTHTVDEYKNKGNCLFVVNTKQWAQRLFVSCKEHVDNRSLFHPSTCLCPAHRKLKLNKIKGHLRWEYRFCASARN